MDLFKKIIYFLNSIFSLNDRILTSNTETSTQHIHRQYTGLEHDPQTKCTHEKTEDKWIIYKI